MEEDTVQKPKDRNLARDKQSQRMEKKILEPKIFEGLLNAFPLRPSSM